MTRSIIAVLSCLMAFSVLSHDGISFPANELQQRDRAIEQHSYPDAAFLATKGVRSLSLFVTLVAYINNRLLQAPSRISYAETEESIFHLNSKCRQPTSGRAPPHKHSIATID